MAGVLAFAEVAGEELKPRELFYTPVPPAVAQPGEGTRQRVEPAKAPGLAIRYRVQRKLDDGGYIGVDPGTVTFGDGDVIRLAVQANRKGYLYALAKGSSGMWQPLFPPPGQGAQPLDRNVMAFVPPEPGAFVFDDKPGREQLFVMVADKSDFDIAKLAAALNTKQDEREVGPVVAKLLNFGGQFRARDLVYERVKEPASKAEETAFYAAGEATFSGAPLIFRVTLNHEK